MNINIKIGFCLFFSILMLIPLVLPFQETSATIENNLYKFDAGFYDKIEQMQLDIDVTGQDDQTEILTHSVIIITNNGYENQLQEILEDINADIIFTDNTLDYVIAESQNQ